MMALLCPPKKQISQYLFGQLPEEEASFIEEHLSSCAECEQDVIGLEMQTDPFVDALRQPPPRTFLQSLRDSHFQKVVNRIKHLKIEDNTVTAADSGPALVESGQAVLGEFGQYQIIERIGHGGMGTVYRAVHTRLDKPVAIKIVAGGQIQHPDIIARFEREMRAIGKMDHPNLVRALDAGETKNGEYLFLVMDLIPGKDVASILREQHPLPIADACEIARQAALGLLYVHSQRQIHRDVKPSNLMLTPDGTVKILDLGLALLNESTNDDLTSRGQMMGTIDYMAPEQCDDSHAVGTPADVYALGCTLYALLTGRPPYAEVKKLSDKIVCHAQGEVPELRQMRSDIPEGLAELVHGMLNKSAEARPTMREIMELLSPYAASSNLRPLVSTSTEIQDSLPMAIPVSMSIGELPSIRRTVSKPLFAMFGLVATCVLVTAGMLSMFQYFGGSRRPSITVPEFPEGSIVNAAPVLANGATITIETVRPRGHVQALAYNPEGTHFAVGGTDGVVRIYEAQSGKLKTALVQPTHPKTIGSPMVSGLDWSSDGKRLAVACRGPIYVWNVEAGNIRKSMYEPFAYQVKWSPDDKWLISYLNNQTKVTLWDAADGERVDLIQTKVGLRGVLWTPNSQQILVMTDKISVFDVDDCSKAVRQFPYQGMNFGLSPDGKMLACVDSKNGVQSLDLKNGRIIGEPLEESKGITVEFLKWTNHGQELVGITGREVFRWRARDGKLLKKTTGIGFYSGGITRLDFAPDGKSFAWFGKTGAWNGMPTEQICLAVIDTTTGRPLHMMTGPVEGTFSWKPDGTRFVLDRNNRTTSVWDVRKGRPIITVESGWSNTGPWLPGTDTLCCATGIYDSNTGRKVRSAPRIVDVSRDGSVYLILEGGEYILRNAKTNKPLSEVKIAAESNALPYRNNTRLSPDGRYVWISEKQGVVNTKTGKTVFNPGRPSGPGVWAPDGKVCYWSKVMDPDTGKTLHEFSFLRNRSGLFRPVGWSSDSKQLVTLDGYSEMIFCRLDKKDAVYRIPAVPNTQQIHWSADDKTVFVSANEQVHSFDPKTGKRIATLIILPRDQYVVVGANGHYRGSPRIERELIYIVREAGGQRTYTPDEFATRYGWKNKESQVQLVH